MPTKKEEKHVTPLVEEETEVKTFKIDVKCPKCKAGYFRPIAEVYTNGAKYHHACNNVKCDNQATFNTKYPYYKYS